MALLPCHALFQFYVADRRLSCQLYQRSADALLGVPFNIASYALLTHMVAQQCDLEVGEFIWTGGDCHLYLNHLEQADPQLTRSGGSQVRPEALEFGGHRRAGHAELGHRPSGRPPSRQPAKFRLNSLLTAK